MPFRQRLRRLSRSIGSRIDAIFAIRGANTSSASLPNPNVAEPSNLASPRNATARHSDIDISMPNRGYAIAESPVLPQPGLTGVSGQVAPGPGHTSASQPKAQGDTTPVPEDPSEINTIGGWPGLYGLVRVLDRSMDALGPLRAVVDELVACAVTYQSVASGRSEFTKLQAELETLFEELQRHYSDDVPPEATASIESICRSIQRELAYVREQQNRGITRQMVEAGEDANRVLACYRRIRGHMQRLTLNSNLSMWKITDELATNARLDRLSPAHSARYNSGQAIELKRGECTPGTRIDVLAQMHGWIHNPGTGSVYWLNGMAGTGKTTIAYTLCTELELAHNLGASFFCSRSLPECRDVNRIIPSIAYQLARFSRPFRCALSKVLEKEQDVHTQLPRIQLEKLVVKPIEGVRDTLPEDLVVVIDALDECEVKKSTRQILEALLTKTTNLPIKFFLASRPEPEIREQIQKQGGHQAIARLVLHELDKGTVQGDIETYLRAALKEIDPSESEIAALVERAGISFIYTTTVVRYVGYANFTKNPRKRLRNVLEGSNLGANSPYGEIDKLYTLVLAATLDDPDLDDDQKANTKQVLYGVLCVHKPLTVGALSVLLGIHDIDRVFAALAPLWPVLHVVEFNHLVTTLHPSFPDYMFSAARSGRYHCDQATHHHALTKHCLDRINKITPEFNICGLETSCMADFRVPYLQTRIRAAISTDTLYACQYWGSHLEYAKGSSDVLHRLYYFLSSRLLLWMEIMNLNACTANGVTMLLRAEKWCTRHSCPEDMKQLLHESWRFVTAFASNPVSQSTPHIYVSMLPFWPESSLITKIYAAHIRGMVQPQGTAMSRRSLSLLSTWVTSASVASLTWSPDGTQIAIVSDGRVFVRDSVTGESVWEQPNRPKASQLVLMTPSITSIGYSSDGAHIASGSRGGIICVWDSQTGKKLLGPLEGHTKEIKSIVFSLDNKFIVSGSEDGAVRIWDGQSGKRLLGSSMQHQKAVTSVMCSPDGSRIVSGSRDKTIKIWDLQTGQLVLGPIEGHTDSVNSVAFSPDGTCMVSGSHDKTIVMWDVLTGQRMLSPFHGHSDSVSSVAFSPDSTSIVSGSYDHSIRIWDARTGKTILDLSREHTDRVHSVSFSRDGTRIALASSDKSVRVWDAQTQQSKPNPLQGHTGYVTSVAFSADGDHIVSGSQDKTIRVWDAQTGQPTLNPLERHIGSVMAVAFSPSGARIASGSCDSTIHLWDSRTGQATLIIDPLKAHTKSVSSLRFSPNGTRLVSGSYDSTIRVWDAHNGQPILSPLRGHTDLVLAVTFSPDGARIASGSDDHTVRMWDAQTGTSILSPLRGHTGYVTSVAFSPDGIRLASGSFDSTIRLWDARSGKSLLSPLEGHSGPVNSVAFSPDSSRIISGSYDKTIRMWNGQTGQLILGPLLGHASGISTVSFSPDGTHIVSGSYDTTIRMWDAQVEQPKPRHLITASPFLWEVTEDGWVVDGNDKSTLLIWVPSDLRPFLLPPRVIFTTSTDGFVRLNFDGAYIGSAWTECYQPHV